MRHDSRRRRAAGLLIATGVSLVLLELRSSRASPEAGWYGAAVSQPCWSPDGKKIAFAANLGTNEEQPAADIWVTDLRARTATRLTSGPAFDTDPCWSLDGRLIYYLSAHGERTSTRLTDPAGTQQLRLADEGWSPRWVPDGSAVDFLRCGGLHRSLGGARREAQPLFQLPEPVQAVDGSDEAISYDVEAFDIRQDGRILAVLARSGGLFTFSAREQRWAGLLAVPGGEISDPVWSPDGRQVAFVLQRLTDCDLWLANADGTGLTRVTYLSEIAPRRYVLEGSFRERAGAAEVYRLCIDGATGERISHSRQLSLLRARTGRRPLRLQFVPNAGAGAQSTYVPRPPWEEAVQQSRLPTSPSGGHRHPANARAVAHRRAQLLALFGALWIVFVVLRLLPRWKP